MIFKKVIFFQFLISACFFGLSSPAEEPTLFFEDDGGRPADDVVWPDDPADDYWWANAPFSNYRLDAYSFYHIDNCSADGKTLTMTDGSKWEIPVGKVSWKKNETVLIRFSDGYKDGRFNLFNIGRNVSHDANLLSLPDRDKYTYRITYIDRSGAFIVINNDTVWKMNSSEALSSWQIGDRIIVGVNSQWGIAYYPEMFINVEISETPHCFARFHEIYQAGRVGSDDQYP